MKMKIIIGKVSAACLFTGACTFTGYKLFNSPDICVFKKDRNEYMLNGSLIKQEYNTSYMISHFNHIEFHKKVKRKPFLKKSMYYFIRN